MFWRKTTGTQEAPAVLFVRIAVGGVRNKQGFCYAVIMATTRCLAFLLCDRASRGEDGKVNLHGIFDQIVAPRTSRREPIRVGRERGRTIFFAFYKVAVGEPCKLELRVFDPVGAQVPGPWSDEIRDVGLMQTVWALAAHQFKEAGTYTLELVEILPDSTEVALATTEVVVVEPRGNEGERPQKLAP
jgi:hypothetical protein